MSRHDATLAAMRAAHVETKDMRFLDAANAIERLSQDVKETEAEIAEAWDAFGTRANRGTMTLQEQISSLIRENDELDAGKAKLGDADRVIAALERLVPDFTSYRDLAEAVEAALKARQKS